MSEIDTTLLPAGQQAIEKLISMFELEKALYELRYELNNRPSWVPVAVAGRRGCSRRTREASEHAQPRRLRHRA